ncbi:hypothetical protein M0R88_13435 [Halorussus gelatinilyticus]|uniref:Uncharacterized protein n=1 Tax=Halorussus gelatinilyticus TaxID=2937524 RepID=A0A8U0IEL7_9EURY|nr:hypothetical protein [Halorussus gelatinilyticus]UPV99516.1 hypothetical protein M0R88_13435 [Halorussus gelatinilyticus]
MHSRPLAALSLGVLLVLAGCAGSGSAPGATDSPSATAGVATTDSETSSVTSATSTASPTTVAGTETTTRASCSLDANATLSSVSKPETLSEATARRVAETVASRYQSARVDEHTYFNHHTTVSSVEPADGGYRVALRGELDYDERGGENATVVHVHRPYSVTYRVTDWGVVRRGEAGATGTVVCW